VKSKKSLLCNDHRMDVLETLSPEDRATTAVRSQGLELQIEDDNCRKDLRVEKRHAIARSLLKCTHEQAQIGKKKQHIF
jgi:hypothetical protein